MRAFAALAALGVLLGGCGPGSGTWVVAGQSNAVGWSTEPSLGEPLPRADGGVGVSLNCRNEVRITVDPLGSPTSPRRSPWPFLAASLLMSGEPTPQFIHNAVGSTCLVYADPRHPGEPGWDPATGLWYSQMVERVRLAQEIGFLPPRAVLWDQGGCEAIYMPGTLVQKRDAYRDALLRLADAIQIDLGPIPLVAARISADPRRLALHVEQAQGFAAVRAAIAEAAAIHPMIFLGPDQADGRYTWEADGIHVRSVDVSGRDWADAIERAEAALAARTGAAFSERPTPIPRSTQGKRWQGWRTAVRSDPNAACPPFGSACPCQRDE